MKSISQIKSERRAIIDQTGDDGGTAQVFFPYSRKPAFVIFSFGGEWDHVSVSFSNRCPTWDEMCTIKNIFFEPEECVIQYHPAKSDYVNRHPYCLHLWKPQNVEIPKPPKEFV